MKGWWERMGPVAALAFVAACVLALALTPMWMTRRLTSLRERTATTTSVASLRMDSLRLLLSDEIIAHELVRQGAMRPSQIPFADYQALRADERAVVMQLHALVPRIGHDTPALMGDLDRALAAWHAPSDARASGGITEAQFVAVLPRLGELRDSVLAAHRRLDLAIDAAEAHDRERGSRVIAIQRIASGSLGVVAALALALLGWLAHRERALARALTAAVAEQSRLRAIAEERGEDLVKVSESKARLIRGFTHDVKNPIGAADGYLQLVEDGLMGPVTEQQASSLGRARRAIRTALALIGDLLELARVDSGNLTVDRAPTDVRALAIEVADEFRAQAAAKGLAIETDAGEDVPPAETDATRVRQVIGNLVSNAVKYTPAGRVIVRVGCDRGQRDDDVPTLRVEVEDTGPGIPAEKQRLLFQEFTRLDPTAAPGIGIGLAMASRITDALGGALSVRSEVGRGSTFVLELPAMSEVAAR